MSLPALDIPSILREYGLRPDKSLGQNFLIDESALQRITAVAGIEAQDTVLEIGPGLGSLTRYLAQSARRVIAVELDEKLLNPLQRILSSYKNVEIIQGDILALDPVRLLINDEEAAARSSGLSKPGHYRVVANIPYYITSALIRHLLEARLKPEVMVLTIQKEVARRLSAEPGDMSLLALSVQVYGSPGIAAHIPAGAFYPPPEIDSSVVRVDLFPEPRIPTARLNIFFRLAKAGFSQKRKTLRNSLSAGMAWPPNKAEEILRSAQIDPMRRAETLSIDEWKRLTELVEP